MAYILMRDYDTDLMGLNAHLHHAYIESHTGTGGERRVVWLRQHEKGLPITLRENYSDDGFLRAETYERDARRVENELLKIRQLSNQGANICVPLAPLTRELDAIQRLSPKLAGYLKQRLNSIDLMI